MAYIYRYKIKYKNHCENLKLIHYEEFIKQNLIDLFDDNLKDFRITPDFYEFKLYTSVKNSILQEMGRKLSNIWRNNNGYKNGFIRMPQELYAILYPSNDNGINRKYIEFIDVKDIDEIDRLSQQAGRYLLSYRKEINNDSQNNDYDQYKDMFYIDILSAEIQGSHLLIQQKRLKEITCYRICGYHRTDEVGRSYLNNKSLENKRIYFDENIDIAYLLNHSEDKSVDKYDYIQLIEHKKVKRKETKKIIEKLKCHINDTSNIDAISNICNSRTLEFCVYNVGQGLATSLSYKGCNPFLYFDYGMSESYNYFTRPKNISAKVVPNSTIILSHIHRDHWYRLLEDIDAFKCNWYIPNQVSEYIFQHRCAEIIINGGSVNRIINSIDFTGGYLIVGQKSKYNSTRVPSHKHESGLALRLEMLNDMGTSINILIAGDQRYDYIDDKYLSDLDILVASHHGGEYSWSKRKAVMDEIPIPKNNDESTIIYSYGLGKDGTANTHGHPSYTKDYKNRGWKKEFCTPTNGDYKINIRNK